MSRTITARIPDDLAKRLDRVVNRSKDPYAPQITQIILRGLELALKEAERK